MRFRVQSLGLRGLDLFWAGDVAFSVQDLGLNVALIKPFKHLSESCFLGALGC